jgi:hypothetical protein
VGHLVVTAAHLPPANQHTVSSSQPGWYTKHCVNIKRELQAMHAEFMLHCIPFRMYCNMHMWRPTAGHQER